MCQIFAAQDPADYQCETRSIRLNGHCTSIRLEAVFWRMLESIAAREGLSMPQFVSKLHDEVLDLRGDVHNFASLLRCACLADAERASGDARHAA
ncbi:MAG: ribbon-helix-helix domain-containing protein [Dichotomicrobium sp.]